MADKFHVGQKVRIVNSSVPSRIGCVSEIDHQRAWFRILMEDGSIDLRYVYSVKSLDQDPMSLAFEEWQLEPIYDGNEKYSWSECAWKPKQKVTSK